MDVVTTTRTVTVDGIGRVPVSLTDRGEGRPFVLLHGGAGTQSVEGFAELLATSGRRRVLVPVHPGFAGTPRPDRLDNMHGLAVLYTRLLEDLDLSGVTVIGNSIGGWIAAEIALVGSPRVSATVLVDAVGLQIDDHPVADFFSLTMDEVAQLSYYRPDAFRIDVESLPDEQKAMMAANRVALATYGGTTMADPGLLSRLPAIDIPVLVVWGTADRIVPLEHGRAYAGAVPGADLVVIPHAGHLPQLEAPEELLKAVNAFTHRDTSAPTGTRAGP